MTCRYDSDLMLAKLDSLGRCISAVRDVWARGESGLEEWIVRDVAVLNLQRAVQALTDIGHHLLAENGWGLPESTGEIFDLLADRRVLSREQAGIGRGMVGFRNVAVHAYRRLDAAILRGIVEQRLPDLEGLAGALRRATVAES